VVVVQSDGDTECYVWLKQRFCSCGEYLIGTVGGCVWWYVNVYDVCVCFVTSFNFERLKCCLSGGRSAFVSCVIFESRVEL